MEEWSKHARWGPASLYPPLWLDTPECGDLFLPQLADPPSPEAEVVHSWTVDSEQWDGRWGEIRGRVTWGRQQTAQGVVNGPPYCLRDMAAQPESTVVLWGGLGTLILGVAVGEPDTGHRYSTQTEEAGVSPFHDGVRGTRARVFGDRCDCGEAVMPHRVLCVCELGDDGEGVKDGKRCDHGRWEIGVWGWCEESGM